MILKYFAAASNWLQSYGDDNANDDDDDAEDDDYSGEDVYASYDDDTVLEVVWVV